MREMKDSGVVSIGMIPVEWKAIKLKFLFGDGNEGLKIGTFGSAMKGKTLESGEYKIYNQAHLINNDFSLNRHFVSEETFQDLRNYEVKPGDVLFSMMGTIGKCRIMPEGYPKGIMDSHLLKAGLNLNIVHPQYFVYAYDKDYSSQVIEQLLYSSNGTIMNGLNSTILKNVKIAMPYSLGMQRKIVNYLDTKCSKIDEIIEKQQVIIEKLKEYKFSIITEAVTKGINPDVELKDSGSVWFGSIPTNWEMKRLKYVFHIQKDIAGEEGHTVLSITQKGIIPKDFSNNEGQFANSYANYQLVHKGDFAMNHMDLLTGWVDISKYEGVTSPDYRVFVLNDKNGMCPEYYLYMMQMCYSARIFYGLGQGVSGMGRWRLQADKFLNFHIPIPPYDEQKIIADYITDKVNHIEVEIDKRNKLVEKYQEYKKSLIYEVVTGKKEV